MDVLSIVLPFSQVDKKPFSLDDQKIPRHVAIIMDGNRRWAKRRGLPSSAGHIKGAATLMHVVSAAADMGIEVLTVFAFSTENWGRSDQEVQILMDLLKSTLIKKKQEMIRLGIRLDTIGDISRLPPSVYRTILDIKEATKEGNSIQLVLAINYGSRNEITRAMLRIAKEYKEGILVDEQINEALISKYLDTKKWPDPDLVIRTSGERRLSNFLLWQVSYAEVHVTEVLWPDFNEKHLSQAISDFQMRESRKGR